MESTEVQSRDRSQPGVHALPELVRPMNIPAESSPSAQRLLSARRRFGPLLWALTLGVGLLSGCAKKSSESAAPEAPGGDWGREDAGGESSVEELERRLGAEERRLRSAGVALPAGPAGAVAGTKTGAPSFDAEASEPGSVPAAEEMESEDVAGGDRGTARDRRRCTNVCDLSRSICDLEAQICSLAERHVDDRRYSEVCERASADCRVAQEACNACT